MNRRTYIYSKNYNIFPNTPPGNEKFPLLSNPVPYPEYLYSSISAFLVKLTAANKQLPRV